MFSDRNGNKDVLEWGNRLICFFPLKTDSDLVKTPSPPILEAVLLFIPSWLDFECVVQASFELEVDLQLWLQCGMTTCANTASYFHFFMKKVKPDRPNHFRLTSCLESNCIASVSFQKWLYSWSEFLQEAVGNYFPLLFFLPSCQFSFHMLSKHLLYLHMGSLLEWAWAKAEDRKGWRLQNLLCWRL